MEGRTEGNGDAAVEKHFWEYHYHWWVLEMEISGWGEKRKKIIYYVSETWRYIPSLWFLSTVALLGS